MAACLAGACPTPADKTFPMITWLTSFGSRLALEIAPLIAIAPRLELETEVRVPRNEPIGVLANETITLPNPSSFLHHSFITNDFRIDKKKGSKNCSF